MAMLINRALWLAVLAVFLNVTSSCLLLQHHIRFTPCRLATNEAFGSLKNLGSTNCGAHLSKGNSTLGATNICFQRQPLFIFGLVIICLLFLIVTVANTRPSVLLSSPCSAASVFTVETKAERIPKHAKHCVPFYELLEKALEAKTGRRRYSLIKTNLTLIGAYAYPDYSVVTIEADGWFGKKVYCHYYDVNWKKLSFAVESVVFPEFVVHCCRHSQAAYMGITESEKGEVMFTVPVLDRTVDMPKYNLSVCLAPLYGDENKWLLLTELVEHYKLQGVQHFYVYIKNIDEYTRLIVDDYEKSGDVEVVYFKKEQDRLDMEWHFAAVADCLQRSRHHSRYAIFVDLDERLMALENQTLANLIMIAMTNKPNIGMLQFRMRWVIRTTEPPDRYEGEDTLRRHLPTLVFHNTSAVAPQNHMAKCVIDPRRVLLMWIHHVMIYFPGYSFVRVSPNKAIIRHYRILIDAFNTTRVPSILSRIEVAKSFGNFTMTDYPKHLLQELYENVKKRLTRVYKKS